MIPDNVTTENNKKKKLNDWMQDEIPGYGIGVPAEDLYKPDLPSGKCPNWKPPKEKTSQIEKGQKDYSEAKDAN